MTWEISVADGAATILSAPPEPDMPVVSIDADGMAFIAALEPEPRPQSRITPDLELQRAVRLALLATPDIAEHITPDRIRTGMARPENMPVIIMTPAQVDILGRASGGYVVTEIAMKLHLWTAADHDVIARQITTAALFALMDAPRIQGCTLEGWDRPTMAWIPDPDPALSCAHAVIALRAIIYWRPN